MRFFGSDKKTLTSFCPIGLEVEGGGGGPPAPSKMIRAIRVIRAKKNSSFSV